MMPEIAVDCIAVIRRNRSARPAFPRSQMLLLRAVATAIAWRVPLLTLDRSRPRAMLASAARADVRSPEGALSPASQGR